MYVLIILFAFGIIAMEVPRFVKNKNWRELAAFSLLMLTGLIYSLGLALDLRFPNPNLVFKYVFSPITQYLNQLLP